MNPDLHRKRQEAFLARAGSGVVRPHFALAIVAALALAGVHLVCWSSWHGAARIPAALAGIALGLLAADLLTGAVHWACDTWGSEDSRWFGIPLIRAFREHHRQPLALLRHDWTEVNGEAAAAAGLAYLGLATPPAQSVLSERPLLYAFLGTLIAASGCANQIHRWAHDPRPPRAVRWLQRRGLLLSPRRHARHHRAPHARAYCITGGWLDGALDALAFWRVLERAVARITGAEPRASGPQPAIVGTGRERCPHPERR